MNKTNNGPLGDSIRRDDMKVSQTAAFDAMSDDVRKSLKRAASHGSANLPSDLGEGWMMVPSKRGLVQVAYKGSRAFSL